MPGISIGSAMSPAEEEQAKSMAQQVQNPDEEAEEVSQRTYTNASIAGTGKNPTQLSQRVGPMGWAEAIVYARELREGGHHDWRLPSIEELALFVDSVGDDMYHWTRSIRDDNLGTWIAMRLSDGNWYSSHYYNDAYVRCVR